MTLLEVLCEGESDVPVLREVLTRRFKLEEGTHFRIHAHKGKGKLPPPDRLLTRPDPRQNQLLTQLPVKLKNIGKQSSGTFKVAVLVLVDADDDDCVQLKKSLIAAYAALPTKPAICLFRIAVEETESWFLADPAAVKAAFSVADKATIQKIEADSVCGAWERLAESLGIEPTTCTGRDKTEWAGRIAPHLDLLAPKSPSLKALVTGISRLPIHSHP